MKQQVNLIAKELLFPEQVVSWKPIGIHLVLVLYLGAIVGWYLWEQRNAKTLEEQIQQLTLDRQRLQQEMQVLTGEMGTATQMQNAEPPLIVRQLERVQGLYKSRILWSDVLRRVSILVPTGVYFTRVETSEDKGVETSSNRPRKGIHFVGFARSLALITYFMAEMEESDYFTDVQLVYAKKDSDPSVSRIGFELVAYLSARST
jgi:Tfp pilus assembly protein PilN